tara:strand:+ start:616 stop:804 length:189 start_codon:yes stop_codon:yes gene_type:complete
MGNVKLTKKNIFCNILEEGEDIISIEIPKIRYEGRLPIEIEFDTQPRIIGDVVIFDNIKFVY